MPLRWLRPSDSYPGSVACPIGCRLRDVIAPPLTSALTCRREKLLRLEFFDVPRARDAPVGCSSADSASARAEMRSSTTSLRFHSPPALLHRPVSSLSVSLRLVRPSVVPRRDLPAHESLSASPPLLSPCWLAPPSTRCDKNAPHTAATSLPDKTPPDSPPAPNTCRKRKAARPAVHAPSGAAERLSNSPYLPSILPSPPALREILPHS